ncbi:MAG TPA: hypothetical protein VK194_08430 [Candidatus Deferrimicrobium sp.]|nr:hypothetical protein [Candidatus Deferrimicrobium sp.]
MTSNNGGFPVDRLDPAATAPDDTEGHRLASNDNETVVDEPDTEGHRLAANDNETIVEGDRR